MVNFKKISEKVDTNPLLERLLSHPFLWDKNPARLSKNSPHWDSHDIFLRGEDQTDFLSGKKQWKEHGKEHIPVWYESIDHLPQAVNLILGLSGQLGSEMIGGCYIYKVCPGHKIYPHIDKGWHPEYFDKFNICLQSNDKAAFVYEEDRLVQMPGDIHWFRNDKNHSVVNEGDCDHIIMIVCLRFDRGYRCPWNKDGWTIDKQIGR